MKDFKKAAKSTQGESFIMDGREKIETALLIATYPDGVTVTGADLLKGDSGSFAACIFAEDPDKFFFGGQALTSIVKEWSEGYDDLAAMSADLAAAGGVKMKFERTKTKAGRDFVAVTIL